MIALKNLQYLSELLKQEELIRAVAAHYKNMVSDTKIVILLDDIIKTSQKNYDEMLSYIKSHK